VDVKVGTDVTDVTDVTDLGLDRYVIVQVKEEKEKEGQLNDTEAITEQDSNKNEKENNNHNYSNNSNTINHQIIEESSSPDTLQQANNPSQASQQSQLIDQLTPLKAGESIDHASTPATTLDDIVAITKTIHRIHPHSDVFRCDNCRQTGDKWFMQQHQCMGSRK